MESLVPFIVIMLGASTPLIFAAIGELVTEKSGVLNLGVEGMMLVGAVAAFAVSISTGSTMLGLLAAMGARRSVGIVVRPSDADASGQSGGLRSGADHLRHRPVQFRRQGLCRKAVGRSAFGGPGMAV